MKVRFAPDLISIGGAAMVPRIMQISARTWASGVQSMVHGRRVPACWVSMNPTTVDIYYFISGEIHATLMYNQYINLWFMREVPVNSR